MRLTFITLKITWGNSRDPYNFSKSYLKVSVCLAQIPFCFSMLKGICVFVQSIIDKIMTINNGLNSFFLQGCWFHFLIVWSVQQTRKRVRHTFKLNALWIELLTTRHVSNYFITEFQYPWEYYSLYLSSRPFKSSNLILDWTLHSQSDKGKGLNNKIAKKASINSNDKKFR